MAIGETVMSVIAGMCGRRSVRGGDRLREDLGIDSLNMVELLVSLESAIEAEFDMCDISPSSLLHVSDVVSLAEKTLRDGDRTVQGAREDKGGRRG